MDPTSHHYIGFADGANKWSPSLTSTVWVIYSPSHELIHIDGMCVGIYTNNQAEYDNVAGLLTNVVHLDICHLDLFLDSQLLIAQLNNYYQVHDPYLFRKFLRTRKFVRHFESISFTHVPRSLNSIVDQLANDVLEWHINHRI